MKRYLEMDGRYQLWLEEFNGKVYIFCVEAVEYTSKQILTVAVIEDGTLHPLLQYMIWGGVD